MEQGCSSRYTALIDKLMVEDLPARKMSDLQGHLASCPACQHRYNRVVLASRLLEGGPAALEGPSRRELDWVEHAVLERARLVPDSQPARRSVLRWVLGAATAAAAIAIVLPLALRTGPPRAPRRTVAVAPVTELQARGAPARISRQVGVRAFCIQRRQDKVDPVVFEASADPTSGESCEVEDILRFAYTNRSKMSHLFLVGVDRQYQIKWYEPHPPKLTSIKVQQRVVDEPLSRAVKLKVNHQQGPLRLFAIFSAAPLHGEQIKLAVEQVKRERVPLEKLELLPLDDTEQRSVQVNLSQRPN